MKKFKIDANVLALLMLASIFAGWQWMILVMGFIFVFCDVTDQLKALTVKVIAVYAGCLLFGMFFDVLVGIWDLFREGLLTLFNIIGSYADMTEAINAIKDYFLNPIGYVVTYLKLFVDFAILVVKFVFIASVVRNRPMPGLFGFIQRYINYFTAFGTGTSMSEDAPVKPATKASHCPNCGEALPNGAAFCTSCGKRLD